MNINFTCLPNSTSFGETALQTLKHLDKLGHNVTLFPINHGIEAEPENHDLIRRSIDNQANFDYNAPSVRLWHQFDLAAHVGKGKRFGWSIFELDKFNDRELNHLRSQDELIVCSAWGKQVCESNNINLPIHVVPLGVDTSVFNPRYNSYHLRREGENSTVFINVGKTELRKHDILLECFERAFDSGQNVELHMVWKNRLLEGRHKKELESWENMYKTSPLADKITLYDWLPDQRSVAIMLANADCAVFPSHAEGFNFGLLQSMAAGLPVICTNYSAHTEYANDSNAMLINVDELEPAYDGIWFHGQGNWAKFGESQKEQLINHMRTIHHKKQNGEDMFNNEGFETAQKFSWENTAKTLVSAISS